VSNIIVTAHGRPDALIVRGELTAHLGWRIADAFTQYRDKEDVLHGMLVASFGNVSFRWYCVDMSTSIYHITFSNAANPRVFHFQGAAAAITTADREFFSLHLQTSDLIKAGRINTTSVHPAAITT